MAYTYAVRFADGGDAGEVQLAYQPDVDDTICLQDNRPAVVLAVIPSKRIAELVEDAGRGVIQVEMLTLVAPARLPEGPPDDALA